MLNTRSGFTGPSNGHPNATLSVTVIGILSLRARATSASAVFRPSSVVAFWLRRPNSSVAENA